MPYFLLAEAFFAICRSAQKNSPKVRKIPQKNVKKLLHFMKKCVILLL